LIKLGARERPTFQAVICPAKKAVAIQIMGLLGGIDDDGYC